MGQQVRVPAQQLVDLLSRVAGDILSDHKEPKRCIEVAVVESQTDGLPSTPTEVRVRRQQVP